MRVADDYAQAQDFAVWTDHWEAWQLVAACATQWRIITGMLGARYQGIDYQALESVMRMRGTANQLARLEEVRHIEAGVLVVLHIR